MKIFEFETVDSLPALYHPEIDAVVMSDLHLGLEGSATYEGNYVPQFQLDEIKEDVRSLKKETDASKIILNGDIKHEFRFTRFSEKTEIKEFVSLLKTLFNQIKVIRGNHDNYLEEALDGVDLKEKHLEEHVLFTHGHESLNTEQFKTPAVVFDVR
ncbi:MAG: metallophosphoesterase, partial [Candidatus Aenigmatarchaeota archaeon]